MSAAFVGTVSALMQC